VERTGALTIDGVDYAVGGQVHGVRQEEGGEEGGAGDKHACHLMLQVEVVAVGPHHYQHVSCHDQKQAAKQGIQPHGQLISLASTAQPAR